MVVIEATIGVNGRVRDAVVRRSIPLLDAAALDAVRQWEFTPTIVNGAAVPIVMTVSVSFAMQAPAPPPPSTVSVAPPIVAAGTFQNTSPAFEKGRQALERR